MQTATLSTGQTKFYTQNEEYFHGITHLIGVAFGIFALVLAFFQDSRLRPSLAVFSITVIVLYAMSATYHLLPEGRAKRVFRIFDHCSIFLLIAGTYTPYCLLPLSGTSLGTTVLILEWSLAALGILLNAVAMKKRIVRALSVCAYLAMGWAIAVGFPTLLSEITSKCFAFLLAGGIAYTVGVPFYALGKRVKYFHSVWHLFVLAGTGLQFVSILLL